MNDEKNKSLYERAYFREKNAREQNELLLENKTREFYLLSQELEKQNKQLEQTQEELRRLAHYDVLTDLPNRLQFDLDLKRELARAERYKRHFSLLCLDLDFFKNVNDRYGHDAGDIVLQEVARRLKSCVRDEDYVARLGGDEFAIILTETEHPHHVETMAKKIIQAFSYTFLIHDKVAMVGVSIGIAYYPESGRDTRTIHKNADIALYSAKACGRNSYQFFNTSLQKQYDERLEISTALQHALDSQEFFLVYQPRISLRTKKMVGMEVLLRWEHPTLGTVAPNEFISIAEESGLIIPIGEWVLQTACKQYSLWHKANPKINIVLAINISPRQFYYKNFITSVKKILHEYQIPTNLLEFEITEASITDFLYKIQGSLVELNDMGVQFSLDNYDTGYSALSRLKALPIQSIKIGQSNEKHPESVAANESMIVESTIELAKELGLNVVLNGIETASQIKAASRNSDLQAQGYYYSEPLTTEQMTKFIANQHEVVKE
ncbi:MAG: hypothetical protein ACD_46C00266G0002 [uncultured bacterium]|nr:MAG: hypothetical protein ACD_46C00266G0002 [uncultured bacterium]